MIVSQVTLDQAAAVQRAQELLRSKALTDAFAYLRDAYVSAWEMGADTNARERAWHLLAALEALKSHLETVIATGKLAQQDLDRISGRLT